MKLFRNTLTAILIACILLTAVCAYFAFALGHEWMGISLIFVMLLQAALIGVIAIQTWQWEEQLNGEVDLQEEILVINPLN